jgi:type I site-specific restriction endonuclease
MSILSAIEKNLLSNYKIFLADWVPGVNNWGLGLVSIVKQLKEDYHRKKIIIFSNSIQDSKARCKLLQEAGFPVNHIDGETSKNNRTAIKQFFENSEFHIICNVGVIGEGANIPCIDTIIFADDRVSNIGVIQNIGRGLRVHNKKDFCMIVVSPGMINEKFIATLNVYDVRMAEPRNMLITRSTFVGNANFPEYSIDGFNRLTEAYNSKLMQSAEGFIHKLNNLGIRNELQYRNRFKGKYNDVFPAWPEIKYKDFNWDMLKTKSLIINQPKYKTKEEIAAAIQHIINNESDLKILKSLKNNKLEYLISINPMIPYNILEIYEKSDLSSIHWVFNNRF